MNIFDLLSEYKHEIIFLMIGAMLATVVITAIIGRKRFEWLVKELMKMYSGEPSFFSKKRIESGIAFSFAFWITAFYLKMKIATMDIWAFGYILSVWLLIAGYTVNSIQREKQLNGGANGGGSPAGGTTDSPAPEAK